MSSASAASTPRLAKRSKEVRNRDSHGFQSPCFDRGFALESFISESLQRSRMKEMLSSRDPILTQRYIQKADHFLQAMKLVSDDLPAYGSSIALLAVHSSISLNDAIAVGITGTRSRSEDHRRAATELERLCNASKVSDRRGIQHFSWLLSKKSDIAYGDRRLDEMFLRTARDRAERFQAWAYTNFKGVLRADIGT